jgi:hypothetical protein
MRFMPDSAVLGTIGHAKRRAAKGRRQGYGYELADILPTLAGVVGLAWMGIALVIGYLIIT